MTNVHDFESRLARTGATLASLVSGGLGYTAIRTYDKQRDMPISQEAGNARMATYLEVTGAVFLFAIGRVLFRASTNSYALAREHDLAQKINSK
jgi:hypothetical protein